MVRESITDVGAIDVTTGDWSNPFYGSKTLILLFAEAAGDVYVQTDGVNSHKTLAQGEYWRISPEYVLQTGTTATLQMHV